ncbi:MAG: DUF1592 domain-containing protein [Armatimonas sp.]
MGDFTSLRSVSGKEHRLLRGRWWLAGGGSLLLLVASLGYGSAQGTARATKTPSGLPASTQKFLTQNCVPCHSKQNASGGLDLATAAFDPKNAANFGLWVKVHDRVQAGEMPPKGYPAVSPAARKDFLAAITQPLNTTAAAKVQSEGRSTWRRMNRYEYENTLRDVLDAPWLQIRVMLPEDGTMARFNKVGDALDISHVQMSRYMAAANYALHEVMAEGVKRNETTTKRYYARQQGSFVGLVEAGFAYSDATARATFPILGDEADMPVLTKKGPMTVGEKDPATREKEALGVVASSYEPIQPHFDQFRAPVAGRYRLRVRGHSFWAGPGDERRWWQANRNVISKGKTLEPVSLYAAGPAQLLRKLGTVDMGPESTTSEVEVELLKGETIAPDAARFFRSRPPIDDPKRKAYGWHNPLATKVGQPGVAFQWLEVEGPIYSAWPTRGQKLLSGDLPIQAGEGGILEIIPNDPDLDGPRLIRNFMQRTLRQPASEADILAFQKLFQKLRGLGASFTEALLSTYSGVLCSPAFVTLEEKPGPLDDYALASRLSYFLWNSEPDSTLRTLASQGKLKDPTVVGQQADRMLADPRAAQFVEGFLDYWLDLRKVNDASPDETLYNDYYLDDYLVESSVEETHAFFTELIRSNLPARNIVSSDFVTVNNILATLYQLPGVEGSKIRRVSLPKDSVRGGLLTQASVLKVTANGTNTSPVVRGAWITERILGQPVPPPPPSVPAVEPDIRGATTIRDQLAKHRTQATCSSCHAKIDPPGFALENFDVFGGWRDHYRAIGYSEKDGKPEVTGFGKNGQPFYFHAAQPVDPSGVLPDGRKFADIREMKRLLASDERGVARNLARQLATYATGAPVGFGDRAKIEVILDRAQPTGYGVKSILKGIIASELFRNK